MVIYYLAIGTLFIALALMVPGFLELTPIGGVGDLSGVQDPLLQDLEDALLNDDLDEIMPFSSREGKIISAPRLHDAAILFYSMLGSVLLMLPVSWLYKGIHYDCEHDKSIDETTLILPAVVAGIVMVVQHSLALAFSLAGIVAGVQFRRALSDTFDTLFIFVAIAVGIAAGIKALDIAFVLTVFFNFSSLLIFLFGDGLESHYQAQRKLEKRTRKKVERSREKDVEANPE